MASILYIHSCYYPLWSKSLTRVPLEYNIMITNLHIRPHPVNAAQLRISREFAGWWQPFAMACFVSNQTRSRPIHFITAQHTVWSSRFLLWHYQNKESYSNISVHPQHKILRTTISHFFHFFFILQILITSHSEERVWKKKCDKTLIISFFLHFLHPFWWLSLVLCFVVGTLRHICF